MILVTLTIAPPPGGCQKIIDVFWLIIGPIRAQPGCLGCGLYQEISERNQLENQLLYMETWETQEQLERHMRSARYERLVSVMEASVDRPVLRYLTTSTMRGVEYLEAVRMGSPPWPPGRDGDWQEDER